MYTKKKIVSAPIAHWVRTQFGSENTRGFRKTGESYKNSHKVNKKRKAELNSGTIIPRGCKTPGFIKKLKFKNSFRC